MKLSWRYLGNIGKISHGPVATSIPQSNLLSDGIESAKRAVMFDEAGLWSDALDYYKKALDLLVPALNSK